VQIVDGFDHCAHMGVLPELMQPALSEGFD